MSTLVVVEEILRETQVPMSVREIVEHAGSRLPTRSKTPDTVVARDLSMDIKRKGEASLFIRSSPGRYTLRDIYMETLASDGLSQDGLDSPSNDGAAEAQPADHGPAQAVASTAGGDAVPALGEAATSTAPDTPAPEAQPAAEHTPLLATALRAERAGVIPARKPNTQDGQHSAGRP